LIALRDVLDLGCRSDCRVGVGLPESTVESVRQSLSKIECKLQIISFESVQDMVSSLKKKDVDCAVRGTLSSAKVLEEIRQAFSLPRVMRTALLEDVRGKQFMLSPVGIDEGMDRESRLELVDATLSYFSQLNWRIKIGILSKGRPEDWSRSPEIETSLKDGEWLVDRFRRNGRDAEHHSILVERAVAECDLVVAPDGISGNLIFRSMHFLGGGKAYGAPIVNMSRVFVDTSRAKSDFVDSVLLAAGLVQARGSN
jgi:putative methanogen marker protein 4